jgi:arylsulfatase A-like enzyme
MTLNRVVSHATATATMLGGSLQGSPAAQSKNKDPVNILFLCVDDMNDWTEHLRGYAGPVYTPAQNRLAKLGVEFTNAHTVSPVCNPCRVAIMTGRRPSTTGIYETTHWWYPHLKDCMTLPYQLKQSGYYVFGCGKIYHHTKGFNPPYQWNEVYGLTYIDQRWYEKNGKLQRPPKGITYANIDLKTADFDWGDLGRDEEAFEDTINVRRCIDFLNKNHTQPFFLAYGTFRPHLPWFVPKKYVDLYPLDSIVLPEVPKHDLDDIPPKGRELSAAKRDDWLRLKAAGRWREAVQYYLASITYADAQIGKLLDALEKSPYADNTVIVFWSDHGFHLGEKQAFHKRTLWEESTRVPFYISVPGRRRGTTCDSPVSLLDIYPTLAELCGLTPLEEQEGHSLVPLLNNPDADWPWPAVTEYNQRNSSVRSRGWRYIQYSDGSEELYNHTSDPNEYTNLANNTQLAEKKEDLAKWAITHWAEPAPTKEAYKFNAKTYQWILKSTGEEFDGNQSLLTEKTPN